MNIAISLHVLAAVIWVGGMFFAHMVLRISAGELEPASRLALWSRVFKRFFAWVWLSIFLLLSSGYWMVVNIWGGFSNLPIYLHIMHGLGCLMFLLFLYIWFVPYKRFKKALASEELQQAAACMNKIRLFVTTNLVFGLINSVLGASGRYW